MKTKMISIFKNTKVIILLVFLIFALTSAFSINPTNWNAEGVSIRAVGFNSTASFAGFENPSSKTQLLDREVITNINGEKISNLDDYYLIISGLKPNRTINIETNENIYQFKIPQNNEGIVDLGLTVEEVPSTNLRKGLDLAGGTRVLLEPDEEVSDEDIDLIISNLQQRLNVYGLSDVLITSASDLEGSKFILIEIAGATEDEVKELLAKQGKFEAKINNETVFNGGDKDITYVCRSASCSGIDPSRGCGQTSNGEIACSFFFSITLSPDAAQRQADLTNNLEVITENGQRYLSDDLTLYLDDIQVDSLRIGAELKGRATTNIQISGSGSGLTQTEAMDNTLQNMKQLQTIIITGSLPVSLSIVKMDTISPSLGQEFLDNLLLIALLAFGVVISVVSLRYRKLVIAVPMLLIMIAEVILILGFASLMKWQLDLAAFAGIIIVVGTGVDHLIIITDETIRGEKLQSMKQRIKSAMFIVIGAYMTTVAGMIPLLWAGAGLLKGFALTTIAGVSFGVLIARPAFAAILEILLKDETSTN